MHVLLIFVDGLGIGNYDKQWNPCTASDLRFLNNFLDKKRDSPIPFEGLVLGLDANLGTPGLPQSATGQTALLTGVNAAKVLGRHLNGFPNERLRQILAESSILKLLHNKGLSPVFLNAFRPPFFDYDPFEIIRHLSVTSVANLYAGLPFFNLDDLRARRCIYQEFTNEDLRRRGSDVPHFTPREAGEILGRESGNYDFCLYEYFQTDRAGHSKDLGRATNELRKLEEFLRAVLDNIDPQETTIVWTSDHGNIEDLSVKGHTRNPAMTILWGRHAEDLAGRLCSITDVTPAILDLFT